MGSTESALIVEVEVERPREFFRGPRWVSLNFLVRFQDMVLRCGIFGGFEMMAMVRYGDEASCCC